MFYKDAIHVPNMHTRSKCALPLSISTRTNDSSSIQFTYDNNNNASRIFFSFVTTLELIVLSVVLHTIIHGEFRCVLFMAKFIVVSHDE